MIIPIQILARGCEAGGIDAFYEHGLTECQIYLDSTKILGDRKKLAAEAATEIAESFAAAFSGDCCDYVHNLLRLFTIKATQAVRFAKQHETVAVCCRSVRT